ncbi:hypothetical protein SAMN03080602_01959 [Arenibacter troitsensis]|uniref:Uncharacterized protein n=1 Tax=Arenibacter troitsensis TaxID=188872 RepID=A0A1X7JPV9_9FLAO|nr:hypothetical protein SAMN03080602_01959 [Arenibacter troitsensis]
MIITSATALGSYSKFMPHIYIIELQLFIYLYLNIDKSIVK